MLNEVIVGVDRPRVGRDGILLAERLMARGGTLTLACVLTSDPLFYRGASASVAEAERTERLSSWRLRAIRRGSRPTCAASGGQRLGAGCTRLQRSSAVTSWSWAPRLGVCSVGS